MSHLENTNQLINWQQHFKNWETRISSIKHSKKLSDFRFIVGPEKTVFHAHKFIFAILSPEFENLFYLLESDMKEIILQDTSPEIFQEFFDFIYTGVLELTPENVEEIMKIAKLYSITSLSTTCENFLEEKLEKSNVLKFLDLSLIYELIKLEKKCFRIIEENSTEIIESPEFLRISKNSLEKIVKFEMLSCKEIKVFEAVDKWSRHECERKQLAVNSLNKRSVIGDIMLKIRFSEMSLSEFSTCSDINTPLTDKEIVKILKSLANPFRFPELYLKNRIGKLALTKFVRFIDGPCTQKMGLGGYLDCNISTDKNIYLCGVGIFGRTHGAIEKYAKAEIKIKIKREDGSLLEEYSEDITFDGTERIFEIYFPTPIFLEHSNLYNVWICRNGPINVHESYYGSNGLTECKENDVVFKIFKSNQITNWDTATIGRLASFIYRN